MGEGPFREAGQNSKQAQVSLSMKAGGSCPQALGEFIHIVQELANCSPQTKSNLILQIQCYLLLTVAAFL